MRRCAWGIAVGVTALITAPALAADFATRSGAFAYAGPNAGYSWQGAFFGLNVGHQWARATNSGGASPAGVAGGAQAGYNWQTGQFVIGGETDLQVSAAEDTFAARKFANPWFGSVRGRAGFAMNNVWFYATAGLAYGGLEAQVGPATESKQHAGWTAGAGMELGLSQKVSARAEYLRMDLTDRGYVLTGTNVGLEANLLRLGVNYRF